jgi:hypothetical protein
MYKDEVERGRRNGRGPSRALVLACQTRRTNGSSRCSTTTEEKSTSMAGVPLRLVSTPLEVLAGSSAISHNIPTSHPHISTSEQPAIAAGCYTDSALALVSTPFRDRCVLELRCFPLDSSQHCPAAHQLLFPAPILGTAFVSSGSNNTLTLQVCTSSGVIYRLVLPLDLLDSVDETPSKWVSEYALTSLGGDPREVHNQKVLTSFHTSQDGIISLAACTDGRVIKIVWEGDSQSAARLTGESSAVMLHTFITDAFLSCRLLS